MVGYIEYIDIVEYIDSINKYRQIPTISMSINYVITSFLFNADFTNPTKSGAGFSNLDLNSG